MKCYYHKEDYDGICSAAIVAKANKGIELIGSNYHTIPTGKNDTIIIVDLSFSKPVMERLIVDGNNIIWIDHHKTAIAQLEDFNFPGIRKIGVGACELAWQYFFENSLTPLAVKYVSDYDVWKHQNPNTLIFQYGLRGYSGSYDPESGLWTDLLQPYISGLVYQVLDDGEKISNYQEIQDAQYAKGMSYTTTWEGYRVLAINAPFKSSLVAKSMFCDKLHDFVVLFGTRGDEWKYSLYSENPAIDVSEIAFKYGGGGHAGAAGFYSNKRLL